MPSSILGDFVQSVMEDWIMVDPCLSLPLAAWVAELFDRTVLHGVYVAEPLVWYLLTTTAIGPVILGTLYVRFLRGLCRCPQQEVMQFIQNLGFDEWVDNMFFISSSTQLINKRMSHLFHRVLPWHGRT